MRSLTQDVFACCWPRLATCPTSNLSLPLAVSRPRVSFDVLYVTPLKKRENAQVEVFKADGKGMGLKVIEPVSKGQFIAEYVGEVRGCYCLETEAPEQTGRVAAAR